MPGNFLFIYRSLVYYFRNGFDWLYFTIIAVMMAAIVCLNYYAQFPVKHPPFYLATGFLLRCLLFFLPFSMAFLASYFFPSYQEKRYSRILWLLIILAPIVYAVRLLPLNDIFQPLLPASAEGEYLSLCLKWLVRAGFTVSAVKIISSSTFIRSQGSARVNRNLISVALIILLFALPFICIAANSSSFSEFYPRARVVDRMHLPFPVLHRIFYELSYAIDIYSVEVFFRGFLVIWLARFGGMNVILPAACFYVCIHLDKPMGEAIGSFFGALFLGIISYKTRSIWFGVILHVGLAWLMELAGYWVHAR